MGADWREAARGAAAKLRDAINIYRRTKNKS